MNHRRLFRLCVVLAFSLSARAQELDVIRWLTPIPTGNDLNRVIFTDNKIGWIVGNHGTILHSSDGGLVWMQVPSGTTNHLKGITFVSLRKVGSSAMTALSLSPRAAEKVGIRFQALP